MEDEDFFFKDYWEMTKFDLIKCLEVYILKPMAR